jgi:serine/threonine-protein kinase
MLMVDGAPLFSKVRCPGCGSEVRIRRKSGGYLLLEVLGQGGSGRVFRARAESEEQDVALKVLEKGMPDFDGHLELLRNEAASAGMVSHPRIVRVLEIERDGEGVRLVMELMEGGSLHDLIGDREKLVEEHALRIVLEVLKGLAAAHAKGIIHRDLKPENILIDRYRRWRIGDFGIAYALGDEKTGTSGTPAFAAPEQLLGEAQGPATDLFALASIVYFVLAGRPPFGDGPAEYILARQLSDAFPEQLLQDGFPDELGSWIARGLAPRVDDRFADAQEMRTAWRQVVRATRRAEDQRPWWRRLLEGITDEEPAESVTPDW